MANVSQPDSDGTSPAGKKHYRVYARSVDFPFLDVCAASEDEAERIAEDADGGRFTPGPLESGIWEIDRVEEVPDEERFDPIA